jgi:hypothetical protein
MTEFEKRAPDFKGDGVAVWVNEKDGKKYLSIKILNNFTIVAFKNEPKPTTKPEL